MFCLGLLLSFSRYSQITDPFSFLLNNHTRDSEDCFTNKVQTGGSKFDP